jgi:intein-encoded DNA endonuclease-like protein
MKKRLYNHYGAAVGDEVTDIERIMQDASNQVTKYCLDNNLDLRDANSICKTMVDIMFADVHIREGLRIKKNERMVVTDSGAKALNDAIEKFSRLPYMDSKS